MNNLDRRRLFFELLARHSEDHGVRTISNPVDETFLLVFYYEFMH